MRVLFLILLAAMLGGCGHKGPLTLPKPKPDAQKPAPEAQKPEPPLVVLPDERELPGEPVKR
jgi:predicted small lipoprotein YifL